MRTGHLSKHYACIDLHNPHNSFLQVGFADEKTEVHKG